MLYRIFKLWMRLCLQFYFRKTLVAGVEHIPTKGPVLFLSNHPNSFLEACIIACFQPRELHFLVRGDMFEKKWLKPILELTHQIPIFRMKDGFEKLKQNKSTFSRSFEILHEGKCILMFPEASTMYVPYMRPLQKGAARLACGTVEEFNTPNLNVICCGIHFTGAPYWRKEMILEFSNPIEINQYLQSKGNEEKLSYLTQKFSQTLQAKCISFQTDEDRIHQDHLVELELSQSKINSSKSQNLEIIEQIRTTISNYREKKYGSDFASILADYHQDYRNTREVNSYHTAQNLTLKYMLFLTSAFLAVPAIICYCLWFWMIKKWAKKAIKHIEFYAPVRIVISAFAHLIFSILIFILLLEFVPLSYSILILVVLQVSLYFSVKATDIWKEIRWHVHTPSKYQKSKGRTAFELLKRRV